MRPIERAHWPLALTVSLISINRMWRCRNNWPVMRNNAALGGVNVRGDADVDPWIFSAGFGYRFNLGDLFGHGAETAYIK